MNTNKKKDIHFAVDFDRTLAYYDGNIAELETKEPVLIPAMVEFCKKQLSLGFKMSVFTARVSLEEKNGEPRSQEKISQQRKIITKALLDNDLPELEITANKSPKFSHFIDDKAVAVIENTGHFRLYNETLD